MSSWGRMNQVKLARRDVPCSSWGTSGSDCALAQLDRPSYDATLYECSLHRAATNMLLKFSMQSFETGINLQDTRDRPYNTEEQSQYEYDYCRPKCSPLESVTSVEPPLRQCPWPGAVIPPLYFAKSFAPIWVAVQVKHFLGSYG